jgi:UDP-glucose 4-epimerase
MSSAGVLGRSSPPEGFSDASPPAPHDAYTRSKLAAEELLRTHYAESLDTVIIRPPLVYGPGAKGSFSRVMKLASSGWALPLGAMTAPRSLISVRNLGDLLLHVVRAAEVRGLCLLAADTETTNVAELVRFLRAAGGRPPRLLNVPPALVAAALVLAGRRRDVPGLCMPFVVRASAALAELGWVPPHRLQDEILWTVGCESPVGGVR